MPTIAVDATLERSILDEYKAWKRAQGGDISILPPRGGPDARNTIMLSGFEEPFLPVLTKAGIRFTAII